MCVCVCACACACACACVYVCMCVDVMYTHIPPIQGRVMGDLFTSYAAKHVIGQKVVMETQVTPLFALQSCHFHGPQVLERVSNKNKSRLAKIEVHGDPVCH